jgi:hypothetical protein
VKEDFTNKVFLLIRTGLIHIMFASDNVLCVVAVVVLSVVVEAVAVNVAIDFPVVDVVAVATLVVVVFCQ